MKTTKTRLVTTRLIVLLISLCVLATPTDSFAEKIKIRKKIEGSFLTNVAGTSMVQPPYIQVLRSKAGLDYTLARFEKLKNRITQHRIKKLRKNLGRIDYKKNMILGIFSPPMDNYKLSLNKITLDKKEKIIEVDVSYRHKMVTPHIPPKKSIHFMLLVVPISDYPVILQATETIIRSKKGSKKAFKVVTVTGRLMPLKNNRLQLVPVVIKRGSKNSYYVAEPLPEGMNLHRYIGKVVTLHGTISHERNSPYEADLTVNKLIKVYR